MVLYRYYNTEMYTGTLAISLLSSYPISELYITGMTFHQVGDTREEMYCDGHWDDEDLLGKPKTGWNGGFHSGPPSMHTLLLKSAIMRSTKIVVDSKLKDLGFATSV